MKSIDIKEQELLKMIPEYMHKVLDIGSENNLFEDFETTRLDIKDAEIIQDLNISQKIPVPDKSYDLVVLSQILEHLTTSDVIVKEAFRISKGYILVGLPNELTLDSRFRFFFGVGSGWGAYNPYGHKHFFTIPEIEEYIRKFFKTYEKKMYLFRGIGGRFIPGFIRRFLSNILPTLFAGEVYYLIKIKNEKPSVKMEIKDLCKCGNEKLTTSKRCNFCHHKLNRGQLSRSGRYKK